MISLVSIVVQDIGGMTQTRNSKALLNKEYVVKLVKLHFLS